jgi:hypothetical protein
MENKAIFKFNNGNGALLCSNCRVIIKTGVDYTKEEQKAAYQGAYLEPQFCDECNNENLSECCSAPIYEDTDICSECKCHC